MKRIHLLGAGAVLALTVLMFLGCPNTTQDITTTEIYSAIDPPKNIVVYPTESTWKSAKWDASTEGNHHWIGEGEGETDTLSALRPYAGAVLISWVPNPNAKGYRIYRSNSLGTWSYLADLDEYASQYVDYVTSANKLEGYTAENKVGYTYIVEALSANSSAKSTKYDIDTVQSSSAVSGVARPYIPATSPVKPVTDVKVNAFLIGGQKKLVVSWSPDKNASIAENYYVQYAASSGSAVDEGAATVQGTAALISLSNALGKKGTVSVSVYSEFGNGTYYPTSTTSYKQEKDIGFDFTTGAVSVAATIAAPVYDATYSTLKLDIPETATAGVDAVLPTGYVLEVAEFEAGATEDDDVQISAWMSANITFVSKDSTGWTVQVVSKPQNLVKYQLSFVSNGVYKGSGLSGRVTPIIQGGVTYVAAKRLYESGVAAGVEITFTGTKGSATYTVERAEYSYGGGDIINDTKVGTWTVVSGTPEPYGQAASNSTAVTYVLVDEGADAGKFYHYRVKAVTATGTLLSAEVRVDEDSGSAGLPESYENLQIVQIVDNAYVNENETNAKAQLRITWNAKWDWKYQLERIEIKDWNNDGVITKADVVDDDGNDVIPATVATEKVGDTYQATLPTALGITVEDSPTLRKSYAYRLAYTDGTNTSAKTNWKVYSTFPYVNYADLDTEITKVARDGKSISIKITMPDTYADGDALLYSGEKLRIFRAEVTNGGIVPTGANNEYVALTEDAFTMAGHNRLGGGIWKDKTTFEFTDTDVEKNKIYYYKAYVVNSEGELVRNGSYTGSAYGGGTRYTTELWDGTVGYYNEPDAANTILPTLIWQTNGPQTGAQNASFNYGYVPSIKIQIDAQHIGVGLNSYTNSYNNVITSYKIVRYRYDPTGWAKDAVFYTARPHIEDDQIIIIDSPIPRYIYTYRVEGFTYQDNFQAGSPIESEVTFTPETGHKGAPADAGSPTVINPSSRSAPTDDNGRDTEGRADVLMFTNTHPYIELVNVGTVTTDWNSWSDTGRFNITIDDKFTGPGTSDDIAQLYNYERNSIGNSNAGTVTYSGNGVTPLTPIGPDYTDHVNLKRSVGVNSFVNATTASSIIGNDIVAGVSYVRDLTHWNNSQSQWTDRFFDVAEASATTYFQVDVTRGTEGGTPSSYLNDNTQLNQKVVPLPLTTPGTLTYTSHPFEYSGEMHYYTFSTNNYRGAFKWEFSSYTVIAGAYRVVGSGVSGYSYSGTSITSGDYLSTTTSSEAIIIGIHCLDANTTIGTGGYSIGYDLGY